MLTRNVRRTSTKRNIIVETWTGDGGQGKEARTWGIGKTEDGGSYVNLFVKRINAHGEGGEEERWSDGDRGRRWREEKTFSKPSRLMMNQFFINFGFLDDSILIPQKILYTQTPDRPPVGQLC